MRPAASFLGFCRVRGAAGFSEALGIAPTRLAGYFQVLSISGCYCIPEALTSPRPRPAGSGPQRMRRGRCCQRHCNSGGEDCRRRRCRQQRAALLDWFSSSGSRLRWRTLIVKRDSVPHLGWKCSTCEAAVVLFLLALQSCDLAGGPAPGGRGGAQQSLHLRHCRPELLRLRLRRGWSKKASHVLIGGDCRSKLNGLSRKRRHLKSDCFR